MLEIKVNSFWRSARQENAHLPAPVLRYPPSGSSVPKAEDVMWAFTNLNQDRLKYLLSNFVDNVLGSGSPRFDLCTALPTITPSSYFVVVSKTRPKCRIVDPPSRISNVFAAIAIGLFMFSLPVMLGIFYIGDKLRNVFGIEDIDQFAAILLTVLVVVGAIAVVCLVLSLLTRRGRRLEVAVPVELHRVLLMALPEALANRRSRLAVKIVVKLAGQAMFDNIAEMVASGEFATAVSKLLDFVADKALEHYDDKNKERYKSQFEANPPQFSPRPADLRSLYPRFQGQQLPRIDWQAVMDRASNARTQS
jgi:hypothetical protein